MSINMDTVGLMQFGNYFKWDSNKDMFLGMEKHGSKIPGIIRRNRLMEIKEKKG